jgi:1-acyl-sn-glycerol-3-phosphate acyltransferase
MLYSFVKILMTVALRFFYRHIHISGLENVPAKGPAIIISNHPSSLMDAALIGILLKRPIHYYARGDVFINKPITKILSWLHMMPVHNHEGGRRTLDANNNSFSEGQNILSNGGIIVFFPESTSHVERQLLPFRKGVFRLAFKTAVSNHYSFEIPIVPFGITYDHPSEGRREVQVHAGKSLLLSDYKNKFEDNPSATLLHISKDAYEAVSAQVLHVSEKERLGLAENLLAVEQNKNRHQYSSWKIESRVKLEPGQSVCNSINKLDDASFERIRTMGDAYFQELKKIKLEDRSLTAGFNFPIWKSFLVWLGFPLFIAGIILNGLPIYIARRIADKKVSRIDFYSWIFVVAYAFLYLIWVLLLVAIAFFIWNMVTALAILVVMMVTGLFIYYYFDCLNDYRQNNLLHQLSVEEITSLKEQRSKLAFWFL